MKILFLGSGQDAPELLEWTEQQPKVEIVGVIGDDSLQKFGESNSYRVVTLEEAYRQLEADHAWVDLAVSYLYWRILKSPIIDVPQYGCINFHPAPLPDYRGRGGCSFAILDQLTEWGCTAHYVDAGIDTGEIIEVSRFPFDWHVETGISLKLKTFKAQKELYKKTITRVLSLGRLPAEKQNQMTGRYISTREMLEAMEVKPDDGNIDVKAQAFWFPPHEGAYVVIDGKRYTIVNEAVMEQLRDIYR